MTDRSMTVQKQPPYSNLCGPLVCTFMADLVEGRSPENVLYCKEEEQPGWLLRVLTSDKLETCPRKGSGRRPKEALVLKNKDLIITPGDAAAFRAS